MIAPTLILDAREQWRPVDVDESLAAVGYSWMDGDWCRGGFAVERLDLPSPMEPMTFDGLAPVAYHRVLPGGDLHWHQFWTWWPYNPKNYAGFGEHEGDWEMVQTGCLDPEGDRPVLMTCSQHDGGEKREYWRVELVDRVPVVYVARDSHASYFELHRDVTDVADAGGPHLRPELRDFGPWATWPGQWGNSANSPGPLATRRAWTAPHAWHGQAR